MTARINRQFVEAQLRFLYRNALNEYAKAIRRHDRNGAQRWDIEVARLAAIGRMQHIRLLGDQT